MIFFCYRLTCYGITDHHILKFMKTPQNIIFNPISIGTDFTGLNVSSKTILKFKIRFYKKTFCEMLLSEKC